MPIRWKKASLSEGGNQGYAVFLIVGCTAKYGIGWCLPRGLGLGLRRSVPEK